MYHCLQKLQKIFKMFITIYKNYIKNKMYIISINFLHNSILAFANGQKLTIILSTQYFTYYIKSR